jgi:hypothetical protein
MRIKVAHFSFTREVVLRVSRRGPNGVGMISPPSGPTATWALGHAP